MYRINKLLLSTFVVAFSTMMLTGCFKPFTHEDVVAYVEDELKADHAKVHEKMIEKENAEGHFDEYWTVDLMDGSGIQFYVIDAAYDDNESAPDKLKDNYDETMLKYFLEEYDGLESFEYIEDEEGIREGFRNGKLYAEYETLEELEQCLKELYEFKDYVENHGYHREDGMKYELRMNNYLRRSNTDLWDTSLEGRNHGTVTGLNEEVVRTVKDNYLLTCLDYRFEDLLTQFSEKEIAEALKYSNQQLGISRSGDENGPFEYYDDMGTGPYGVSFGTVYKLLEREGFEVKGNVNHYKFIGTEDKVYEVSYNFHEKNPEDPYAEDIDAYYYLVNGEKVWMKYFFYNHFDQSEIKEMTGLVVSQWREDIQRR